MNICKYFFYIFTYSASLNKPGIFTRIFHHKFQNFVKINRVLNHHDAPTQNLQKRVCELFSVNSAGSGKKN